MRKLSVFIAVLALVSGACIGGDDTVTSVTTTTTATNRDPHNHDDPA